MSLILCSTSHDVIGRVISLGGRIGFDEDHSDGPVVRIAFNQENALCDSDLAMLDAFPELRHLVILSDRVTDAGLEQLEHLSHLRWLAIYSRSVTKDGIIKLATALDALEGVSIRRAAITEAEKAAFQEALPWVKWR